MAEAKSNMNQDTLEYKVAVAFELDQPLVFPDFTVRHTELREIQGPNDANWKRKTFFFSVEGAHGSQQISWSTGHYSNTRFSYHGNEYELVMGGYFEYPDSEDKSFVPLDLNKLIIRKIQSSSTSD